MRFRKSFSVFFRTVFDDANYYLLILAYCAIAYGISCFLKNPGWFTPLVYFAGFKILLFAFLSYIFLRALIFKKYFSAENLAGFCLALGIVVFLGAFTSIKAIMPIISPFTQDYFFAELDKSLHGQDVWIYLRWLEPVTLWIHHGYTAGALILFGYLTLYVCWNRKSYLKQYVLTLMTCWSILGNVLPLTMMAGGPIFYEGLVGDPRFAAQVAHLEQTGVTQSADYLWSAYQAGTGGAGAGISAFPSLHVSMATLFMLVGFKISRPVGLALTAYLVFVQIGSVHLGWHYAVDGYVSFLATCLFWWIFGRPFFSRRKRG